MRVCCATAVLVLVCLVLPVSANNKAKSRIEELFVWRVSDSLSLSPEIENKFSEEFKRLSDRKTSLWSEIETLVEQMESTKDPKKIETLLKEHKAKVAAHSKIQLEEVETFEKLFGKQKFAQYLVLKRELTQKLKDFVSSPSGSSPKSESSSRKKLQDPKIIQDESH
jgi:hypothetical protein